MFSELSRENVQTEEPQFKNTAYEGEVFFPPSYSAVLSFHSSRQDVWDYSRMRAKEMRWSM